MTARDLTGLVGAGRDDIPEPTVTAAPPRRQSMERDPAEPQVRFGPPAPDHKDKPAHRPRRQPTPKERVDGRHDASNTTRPTTVRISVNVPLACKQWLASQARDQQRFVSEIVVEALDRFGGDVGPPSGRAKRVAVPDGAICNIVLPSGDRERLDNLVASKNTTPSALLSEVLVAASSA